jgi:hypothetical protein
MKRQRTKGNPVSYREGYAMLGCENMKEMLEGVYGRYVKVTSGWGIFKSNRLVRKFRQLSLWATQECSSVYRTIT